MDAPSVYFATIEKMKADPKARSIAICNCGGEAIDQFALLEFWRTLRPDLGEAEHRRATGAWLATLAFGNEVTAERARLQDFIRYACEAMGWAAPRDARVPVEVRP